MNEPLPRYPIFIPSKGRPDKCLTTKFLIEDGVPFKIVVEPQEYENYLKNYSKDQLLALPFSDRGSVVPARNWIRDYSQEQGFERHWQLDDNITQINIRRNHKYERYSSKLAFTASEEFVDRYTNVAIAGFRNIAFAWTSTTPFLLNQQVYCCILFLNTIPNRWRGIYSEDTDICLQVLSTGWCTVLFNIFTITKASAMSMRGGNTDEIYQGDGRLKMARALQRQWPKLVKIKRSWNRPQQSLGNVWSKFTTRLELKPGVDLEKLKDD